MRKCMESTEFIAWHMVFTNICDLPLPVTTGQADLSASTNRSTLEGGHKETFLCGEVRNLVTKNIGNSDAKRFPLLIFSFFFFFTVEVKFV